MRGDFNNWDRVSHRYDKLPYGKWDLNIPALPDGTPAIKHLSKLKLVILTKSGEMVDRLSPWYLIVLKEIKMVI